MAYPDADVAVAGLLKALAHPARLAMVRALAAGGCGCGDIVRRLPLAQSTVSQHLKILKEAGLVEGVVEGPRASYCLAPDRLLEARAALEMLSGLAAQSAVCGSTASVAAAGAAQGPPAATVDQKPPAAVPDGKAPAAP